MREIFIYQKFLLNHYSMSKELSQDKNSKRNIQKYFDLYKKYSFYDYLNIIMKIFLQIIIKVFIKK